MPNDFVLGYFNQLLMDLKCYPGQKPEASMSLTINLYKGAPPETEKEAKNAE